MRFEEKQQVTEELAARLRDADTIFLTDFTGLDVKAITEFRAKVRDGGLEYRVVKNTLTRRAIEGLELDELAEHLVGPTALLLGGNDPVTPAKIIRDFAKERLASYKVPRRVLFFRDGELEMTGNEKVKASAARHLAFERLSETTDAG